MRDTKHRRLIITSLVATLVVLAGALVFFNRDRIHNQLDAWKLLPRPERLTELYFEDHQNLPAKYTPGTPQQFSFTVHNLEYRPTTYSYRVVASSDDNSNNQVELSHGTLKLDHDKYSTQTPMFNMPDLGARAKVSVILSFDGIELGQDNPTQQQQTIHYWIERTP